MARTFRKTLVAEGRANLVQIVSLGKAPGSAFNRFFGEHAVRRSS